MISLETLIGLLDEQSDGSFGRFYGHPDGQDPSKKLVERMLKEFGLGFEPMRDILQQRVPAGLQSTGLKPYLTDAFRKAGWDQEVPYPEAPANARYKADFGKELDGRFILAEVELSDIRRSVSASYMARVFRTGYMRLGILIAPEQKLGRRGTFYSSLKSRHDYIAPDFPLWVVGVTVPPRVVVSG